MARLPTILDLEDDIIEIIQDESTRVFYIRLYDDILSRSKYTNPEFNGLVDFVMAALEYMEENNPNRLEYDDMVAAFISLDAALFVLANRDLADKLDDHEYRDAKSAAVKAENFIREMERASSRGRGRDRDEDRGRGRGRDRESTPDYTGNRFESRGSRRGRSNEREEAPARSRTTGRGRNRGTFGEHMQARGETDNLEENSAIQALRKLHMQDMGKTVEPNVVEEDEVEEETPTSRYAPRRGRNSRESRETNSEMPEPAEVNVAPAAKPVVTFVHQDPVVPTPTVKKANTEWDALAGQEVVEGDIMSKPLRPAKFGNPTHVPIAYEPMEVRPVYSLDNEGYRQITFRKFDMNYDDIAIPNFGVIDTNTHAYPMAKRELQSIASSVRFRPVDVAVQAENARRAYEEEVKEWEAANANVPEADRDAAPLLVEPTPLRGGETILLESAINSVGPEDTRIKLIKALEETGISDDRPYNLEGLVNEISFAYVATSDEEYDKIKTLLAPFTATAWHEGKTYPEYHQLLTGLRGKLPAGLWLKINKRMTDIINATLAGNLGINGSIDDYLEDGITFVSGLKEKFGMSAVERLQDHSKELLRQFHFVTFNTGEGNTELARGIYFRERSHVVLTSFSSPELGIIVPSNKGKTSNTVRITKEASPSLYKAFVGFELQETATSTYFGITRKMFLSDGRTLELYTNWYNNQSEEYMVRVMN